MNVSTSMIAANASIQNSTASSEPSVLSGRCRGTEEKEKWRWGIGKSRDGKMGRSGDWEIGEGADEKS